VLPRLRKQDKPQRGHEAASFSHGADTDTAYESVRERLRRDQTVVEQDTVEVGKAEPINAYGAVARKP
jgi:hypothetical protein